MRLNNLIVHMEDSTTDFLCPIYSALTQKTVLRKPVSSDELNGFIASHDRVFMLGHGARDGLFSLSWDEPFIVSSSNVHALRQKPESVYIWCHASEFVRQHQLNGFASGMFISEVSEARYCGIPSSACRQDAVDASNELFVRLVAEHAEAPVSEMFEHVRAAYACDCAIAEYNRERLMLAQGNTNSPATKPPTRQSLSDNGNLRSSVETRTGLADEPAAVLCANAKHAEPVRKRVSISSRDALSSNDWLDC